jgi:hypothetical protein
MCQGHFVQPITRTTVFIADKAIDDISRWKIMGGLGKNMTP